MSSPSNGWQRELKLHHAFAASRLTEIEQLHGDSMSPSNSSAGMSLHNHEPFRFVKKREISKLTDLSGDTLKKYRLSGLLCEDIIFNDRPSTQ